MLDISRRYGTGTNQNLNAGVSFSIKDRAMIQSIILAEILSSLSKIMYIKRIDASKGWTAYNEKCLGVGRHRGQNVK